MDRRDVLKSMTAGFFMTTGLASISSLASTSARAAGAADDVSTPHVLGDMVLGDAKAPITIIEYFSMSCGYCAKFHTDVFPKLKKAYIDTGKVRFILREFPLGPHATITSQLARCAPADNYYAMIDMFMERQSFWYTNDDPKGKIMQLAKFAGFTSEDFDKCMANDKVAKGIYAETERAAGPLKVTGTPTFFINGEKHGQYRDFEYFDKILKAKLGG